jgi:Family of unknown function (DUF5317)
MTLILGMMLLAVLAGYLMGGRLGNFASLKIRWLPLALIGLVLQGLPLPGRWPLVLLAASFVLLFAFCVVNIRIVGFPLILVGVVLNVAVIAVDGGMPVTAGALEASGQVDTTSALIHAGGAKHHIATSDDALMVLGDVIGVPQPIGQAISVGDLFTYGGVAVLIAMGMRPRRQDLAAPPMVMIPIRSPGDPPTPPRAHGAEAPRGGG